mgnify:CR=1 FL=1
MLVGQKPVGRSGDKLKVEGKLAGGSVLVGSEAGLEEW